MPRFNQKLLFSAITLSLFAFPGITQADLVVNVTGANRTNGGNATSGASAVFSSFSDNTAASGTIVYKISGLDLDGSGGTNDSVDVTLSITGTDLDANGNLSGSQLLRHGNGNGSGRISYGTDRNRVTHTGDQINFTDISITDVSLNGSSDATWTANSSAQYTHFFLGGTQMTDTAASINGEQFFFSGGTNLELTNPGNSALIELNDPNGDRGAGRFRVDNLSYELTLTAVPEPSGFVLLGLLGAGFCARRKR